MVEAAAHEHKPIRVYDDLRTDKHGRPTTWLYHVECYQCGQDLPNVQPEQLPNDTISA